MGKAFHRTLGIDFTETFSLVVQAQTIKIVFSLAVSNSWSVMQIDLNNAFLNKSIDELVCMFHLKDFEDSKTPNHICKLTKALYGLKYAPRAWFEMLKSALF